MNVAKLVVLLVNQSRNANEKINLLFFSLSIKQLLEQNNDYS